MVLQCAYDQMREAKPQSLSMSSNELLKVAPVAANTGVTLSDLSKQSRLSQLVTMV